jgi:prevent-host-death family protein
MMIEIDASQADTDLSLLLDKVEQGEEVVITRHGRPVARLVATEAARQAELDDIVERFRAARQGVRLDGLSIKDMVGEGRR